MSSRDKILQKVRENQPAYSALPVFDFAGRDNDLPTRFETVLKSIGGETVRLKNLEAVREYLQLHASEQVKVITDVPELGFPILVGNQSLHDVDLFITTSRLGVAENGACWIENLQERVAPFITQHLVIILKNQYIVSTMHHAYEIISDTDYDFGVFIAGPSKTADIEQSLVLGAHGARSCTVLLLEE